MHTALYMFGTAGSVLIREVSLIQRWILHTALYMFGTAGSVLIREVSLSQSVLYREVPLYLHCMYLIKVLLKVAVLRLCTPGWDGL